MARNRPKNDPLSIDPVLQRFQSNIAGLQRNAQLLLTRARRDHVPLIPPDQQRALDRLVEQAQELREDLERRARRASKQVEDRIERLLASVEKEAGKRLVPFLKRLDMPTRDEIHALARKVARLEKRLARADNPATVQAPTRPGPPTGPRNETTNRPGARARHQTGSR